MSKILLLGKSGMMGSSFMDFFAAKGELEIHAFGHEQLDVCDAGAVSKKFAEIKPEVVINCTAYTSVDEAEKNRDIAFKVNAEVVGNVAKLCEEYDATLIHFSTDYVFDGEKKSGYREADMARPLNVYGESKLAGEKLIAENMEKFYLMRTCWLFGPNGKNFVDTMLKLGKKALNEGTELRVVNDQIGSPTYTEDLVEAVVTNFIEPVAFGVPRSFGIYHLTNSGDCTWYEFAKKIFEIKKMPVSVIPISSSEFSRPAKRPACSILLNTKLSSQMRGWEDALDEYLVG